MLLLSKLSLELYVLLLKCHMLIYISLQFVVLLKYAKNIQKLEACLSVVGLAIGRKLLLVSSTLKFGPWQ